MTQRRTAAVPEGFDLLPPRGPFFETNGPIWRRKETDDAPLAFGFLTEPRHTNGLGFVHGGMICTFLDGAIAQSIYDRFGCRLVTRELNISFEHVIGKGWWAETVPVITEVSDDMVTARAELVARRRVCAIGTGAFQLFPERGKR